MVPLRAESLQDRLRADGDLKLVPYAMAGYPGREQSIEIGRRLADAGAAALELGIPFSDPLADGPVIQRAGQAALAAGTRVATCLEIAQAVARDGASPVVLMTYVNPILAYDPRRFAADARDAGVAGVILPDLPPEEAEPVTGWLRAVGLDVVFLVAPTSTEARVRAACELSSGFVYCVTITGITGARDRLPPGLRDLLLGVRSCTDLPVAAGFGISRPEHVEALRGVADAAVVGSALVAEVEAGRDPAELVRRLLVACR